MNSKNTTTNRVREAARLDLGALLATATTAETTVTGYLDRAAVQEWADSSDSDSDTAREARERALASRVELRVGRATPRAKAEAIARFPDDRELTAGFPSETVYHQRVEHIVGSAIITVTDSDGATADGPLPQPTTAQLRGAIGENAWAKVRDFATGETDDAALDADFSQAPSGATPN